MTLSYLIINLLTLKCPVVKKRSYIPEETCSYKEQAFLSKCDIKGLSACSVFFKYWQLQPKKLLENDF